MAPKIKQFVAIAMLVLLGPVIAVSWGQVLIAISTATPDPGPEYDLEDSFEGTPPTGWDAAWSTTAFGNSNSITTNEESRPTGGGSYVYRQGWLTGSGFGTDRPDWLSYNFPAGSADEGDVFEFEYYIKYHASFDSNNSYVKQIIARSGTDQYFYIDSHVPGGRLGVLFQYSTDTSWLYSNLNGDNYNLPEGEWIHFRWRIQVATETDGDPRDGYLYGWVNGVKRWEYNNINTIYDGAYTNMNLNTTFNEPVTGENQKRWWDLFKFRAL